MNADPEFPLIDRYLDGTANEQESAALVRAVEADPDVLAALCQTADIEAGLRLHLATPEQRRATIPRLVPLWHWRRAGKWMAATAAAAALIVSAAVVLQPELPVGTGRGSMELASGMTVKRLKNGASGRMTPAQAPPSLQNSGPMEVVEFPVHPQWLSEMTHARPASAFINDSGSWPFAGRFEIPVEGAAGQLVHLTAKFSNVTPEDRTRSDDYLVWYLRACGVTFPPGASAQWLQGKDSFVAVNTSNNVERITGIQQDPARMGAKNVIVYSEVWCVPEGMVTPPVLQKERVLNASEVNSLPETISSSHGAAVRRCRQPGLMALSETQCRFLLRGYLDIRFQDWAEVQAHLQLNQWRVADHVVISGLAGPRPDGERPSTAPELKNAELEFELTMAGGEAAVLHLGRKSDGTEWILVLRVSIGNIQYPLGSEPDFTLGNIPGVMKFDQQTLTVKAGSPVRVFHKNDACPLMHNFVLVKPGSAGDVGALADGMLTDPGALAKHYFPASPDIIVTGTRLLKRGDSEEIIFNAPTEPGDYPYLCTFPGHWRLQQGILRVEP
jgi:azurin